MAILAGVNNGNIIAVIILSIAAVLFVLIDAFLVISLHRHNSKLAERESESAEPPAPAPEEPRPEIREETEERDNNI